MLMVIVSGTDPKSKKGGIGFAMPGYLHAMSMAGIQYESIPTYSPESFSGKYWYLLKNTPVIISRIFSKRDKNIVIYSHAGAGASLAREAFVLFIGKHLGVRTVLQLHALEIDDYLKSRLKYILFTCVVANADRLNVLLPWWKTRLVNSGIAKPINVLPNPLPLEWELTAKKKIIEKNQDDIIQILSLSRVEPGKGVDLVLETMPYLHQGFKLVIAGDGTLLVALKERAKELGVESRVEFTGWVNGAIKQKLFDEANIFCLPSSYDSFGMGFLEAMANGLPIVALDWGPITDIVPDKKVGLLVQHKRPELIAEAIKKLSDAKLRMNMGMEGKRWVLEKFSAKKVGEQLRVFFEDVIYDK